MLMRTQEFVDFNHVPDRQLEIHARLENWARWVRVRPQGWQTQPMFRAFRVSRQWDAAPHIPQLINSLDGLLIERVVSVMPDKHKAALRWFYVFPSLHAKAMQRNLGLTEAGLQQMLLDARNMATNISKGA